MITVAVLRHAALGEARLIPPPRRLCTSLHVALLELRRAPPGATLLLVDPSPGINWAELRRELRRLRARLIVTGDTVPPGTRHAATLEAAVPLLAARPDPTADAPGPVQPRLPLTLIGSSTGGPRVLRELLRDLRPRGSVVVAQHLSEGFSENLIQWLGSLTSHPVRPVTQGVALEAGVIHVAAATHVTVNGQTLSLHAGQPGREYLPSIDRLFQSAGSWRGPLNAVILSGMGDDGARGLAELQRAGARTAVQAPDTCTVPSMPLQALARVQPAVTGSPDRLRDFLERHA